MSVPQIFADIVGANYAFTGKGWCEDRRIARHSKIESLSCSAGKGIKLVGFTSFVRDVIEECAEFSAAQLRTDVGHRLHDPVKIKIAGDFTGDAVEGLETLGLLREQRLGLFTGGDVAGDFGGADYLTVSRFDRGYGERNMDQRPVLALP